MKSLLKNKRVLVTGGAGVIGRELLKLLIKEEANVLSVDRSPLREQDWRGILHLQKDLAVDPMVDLRDFQPQIVFHLAAAFERSKESPEFWDTNWHDNVVLSHRIIDLLKEAPDLEAMVFASSYLVYSPSLYLSPSWRDEAIFLKEDDPVAPRNLCGAAKFYTEREIDFVKEVLNPSLRIAHARIFRVYGCGSKDVISRWIRAALSGQQLEVFNAPNRFDYIFAGDVAEGLLRLAGISEDAGSINLGTGRARSVQEVLSILAERIPTVKSKIRDHGLQDHLEASCADTTKLKQLTGWTPTIDLEKGMRSVIEFEEKRMEKTHAQ